MLPTYKISSTSARSATVEDIWLDPPDDIEAARTRRILRAEIVDNIHSTRARVKACLIHQKRHTQKHAWEDADAFSLATLKAGEEVRLQLGATETFHLFNELERLHTLSQNGVPQGQRNLVVADVEKAVAVQPSARKLLQQLLNEGGGEELWQALEELHPNLFRAIALVKLHELRERAVAQFEAHLTASDWSEEQWQQFFESNPWIFGYGLSYRFLSIIQSQTHYGGTDLIGKGGQRDDFLAATEAQKRFTVLVEIKKPETALILNKLYRNKSHLISGELVGGVSQVQSNCRAWGIGGLQTTDNSELPEQPPNETMQPKGILIIGHTGQLDTSAKRSTFELFRRNLQNPEIITFDELLARARHLLLNAEQELARPQTGAA
ncbi:MAG: hypothetical protein JWN98_232 [Abditibacteriota bacterium]|nr:hypothetical protein [Abditibacteriota bacterium]